MSVPAAGARVYARLPIGIMPRALRSCSASGNHLAYLLRRTSFYSETVPRSSAGGRVAISASFFTLSRDLIAASRLSAALLVP